MVRPKSPAIAGFFGSAISEMIYQFIESESPLLISVPHAGLKLADGMQEIMTATGRALVDTDWHVDRLVEFAPAMGAGLIQACYSRYVIDLNRPANDQALYVGSGTGLVPQQSFSGQPLYRAGQEPDEAEKVRRLRDYWQPYHNAISAHLDQLRQRYGFALLLDAHSIASRVPALFEGVLPDLNLGTFDGNSCAADLSRAVADLLDQSDRFSHVVNGRFKGGFITRHYGQPEQGIHALQLEIAQHCYMDESCPEQWDADRAAPLIDLLVGLVDLLQQWKPPR